MTMPPRSLSPSTRRCWQPRNGTLRRNLEWWRRLCSYNSNSHNARTQFWCETIWERWQRVKQEVAARRWRRERETQKHDDWTNKLTTAFDVCINTNLFGARHIARDSIVSLRRAHIEQWNENWLKCKYIDGGKMATETATATSHRRDTRNTRSGKINDARHGRGPATIVVAWQVNLAGGVRVQTAQERQNLLFYSSKFPLIWLLWRSLS